MKQLILIFSIIFSFLTFSQESSSYQKTKETFYKHENRLKEVKYKKAKFVLRESIGRDSIIKQEFVNLKNDQLLTREFYKNVIPVRVWTGYNELGKVNQARDFSKVKYIKAIEGSPIWNNIKTYVSDSLGNFKQPAYGQNEEEVYQFIANSIQYPKEAVKRKIAGRVFIRIYIDKDGNVKPHSIEKGSHPYLDYEAWEVIEKLSKWKPAEYKGEKVDFIYVMPISFTLR